VVSGNHVLLSTNLAVIFLLAGAWFVGMLLEHVAHPVVMLVAV
jgi:hypothetical protein